MEMLPLTPVSLKDWLETALTRYALGGVMLGEVSKAWMQVPPISEQPKINCLHDWKVYPELDYCPLCNGVGDHKTGQVFAIVPEYLRRVKV